MLVDRGGLPFVGYMLSFAEQRLVAVLLLGVSKRSKRIAICTKLLSCSTRKPPLLFVHAC